MDTVSDVRKGGAWLLEDVEPSEVFTPEKLSDEHRLMAQTTDEFIETEVLPNLDKLETRNWELARKLIRRCGELGLLGTNVPEQYGGLDLDKVSSLIIAEHIARSASFATTYGGQVNLCILPIVLFGTEAQKQQYLPRLVAGELVGAYALSESGSGSDAFAAKTRAVRAPDGAWTLNGEKMWITNGGFADVIIVFAKVDGEHFTAFIVEKAFPGVSAGKEEHKMGLHGSSTTPVLLQDARIPAENVLGAVGKGHKVALNTLNFGRFKLGGMSVGGCRSAIGDAARYAAQRKQFGHAIASFGAIKHKLGEMTARTYAMESLIYRTAGLIDAALAGTAHDGAAVAHAFEEYAVEASIAKVGGTETLDYVLDENVQIHGGNGFVKDYSAERYYRDARVNRIFEGTNEINRMLIPGMLIRRALKSELPLVPAAKQLQNDLLSPSMPATPFTDDGVLDEELRVAAAFKKVALMVLGTAMQTYGEKLTDEQEVLSYAADIMIDTYAAESAVLRARAAATAAHPHADLHEAAARTFVNDAAQRLDAAARSALAAMAEGDTLRTLLAALRRFLKVTPVNTVALRRRLADASVDRGRYILE
ncbi:MAG: acyl-CoA dehydrogenase family protein [Acidobacteria bacterium]|nr:acyl-CoA dehydrogenase family protein [Acidobacteriota bacterium]